LHPGVLYRIVLKTACFQATDYGIELAAVSADESVVAFHEQDAMQFKGRACRSSYESMEFTVATPTNFTIAWNLSEEVAAQEPRLKVVQVLLTPGRALQVVLLAAYGAFNLFTLILGLGTLFRRRPPGMMPTGVRLPEIARVGAPVP
jgi:hypothetical protein